MARLLGFLVLVIGSIAVGAGGAGYAVRMKPEILGLSKTPAPTQVVVVPPQEEKPAVAVPLKIVLYNGTTKVGLTADLEKILKDGNANIEVMDKKNAAKKDYAKTLVVDLAGTREEDAAALAKILEAEVGALPDGEAKPEADFLVIAGADLVK